MLFKTFKWLLVSAMGLYGMASIAAAAEQPQEWELIIPTGVIEEAQVDPAPRLSTLDGKTIVLRWNSKNNGDIFLDRVAELLAEKFTNTKIVKQYVEDPSLTILSGSMAESQRVVNTIKDMGADIVISSQAD